jgi:hypothetical protein
MHDLMSALGHLAPAAAAAGAVIVAAGAIRLAWRRGKPVSQP